MKISISAALLTIALSAAAPGALADQELDFQSTQDQSAADYARVRFVDGSLTLQRYEDDSVEEGSINAPILPGDTVATKSRARAEVQLASGTLIRLDENTQLTFLSLPSEDDPADDATLLQLSYGGAQVEIRGSAPRRGDFQVDTPSASVYLLASGRYRIDTDSRSGRTRVSTYRGVAEVAGDDGSVMLRSGQRTSVESGADPDDPRSFNTAASDSFDEWILDRGDAYRRAATNPDDVDEETIPDPVRPYRNELSYYGRWVTISEFGSCWIPAGVGPGWRPYYNGYWSYGSGAPFWVSNDPWGWAPYHFGRWSFYSGYGWVWIPGRVFSGAWVSWYYGPSYVGWCPLDFWDYPIALSSSSWGIDYRCWNFVPYRQVYTRQITRVYVHQTIVRQEVVKGGGVVVRHPLKITPFDVQRDRVSPPALIKRGRSLGGNAVIDFASPRERVVKRAFKETEKQVVDARRIARRNAGPSLPVKGLERARPGDAAGARVPGAAQRPARLHDPKRSPGSSQGEPGAGASSEKPSPRLHRAPARSSTNGPKARADLEENRGQSGDAGDGATARDQDRSTDSGVKRRPQVDPQRESDSEEGRPANKRGRVRVEKPAASESDQDQPPADRNIREFFRQTERREGADKPSADRSEGGQDEERPAADRGERRKSEAGTGADRGERGQSPGAAPDRGERRKSESGPSVDRGERKQSEAPAPAKRAPEKQKENKDSGDKKSDHKESDHKKSGRKP